MRKLVQGQTFGQDRADLVKRMVAGMKAIEGLWQVSAGKTNALMGQTGDVMAIVLDKGEVHSKVTTNKKTGIVKTEYYYGLKGSTSYGLHSKDEKPSRLVCKVFDKSLRGIEAPAEFIPAGMVVNDGQAVKKASKPRPKTVEELEAEQQKKLAELQEKLAVAKQKWIEKHTVR